MFRSTNIHRFLIAAIVALTIASGVVARRTFAEPRRPKYDFPRAVQRLEEVLQAEQISYAPDLEELTVTAYHGTWKFVFHAVPDKGRVPAGDGLVVTISPDGQARILRGL